MRCSSELADIDKWGGRSGLFFSSLSTFRETIEGGDRSLRSTAPAEHQRGRGNTNVCIGITATPVNVSVKEYTMVRHASTVAPFQGAASPRPVQAVDDCKRGLAVGAAWGAWAMTCPRLKSGDDRKEIGRFCVCVAHSPQSRYASREERREREN